MFSIRMQAAIGGELEKFMAEQSIKAKKSVTWGMHLAANGLKEELRSQVMRAGFKRKIATTWRSETYPNPKKNVFSIDAASVVKSKAPDLMKSISASIIIKSKHGFFLAIPTDAAPKKGVGNNKRINPTNFPVDRFGPLRFVYRKRGHSLLVVDGLRARTGKRGGFSKASKSATAKGNVATVIMFILVPQVRTKKLIDIDTPHARWSERAPTLILQQWNALDDQR